MRARTQWRSEATTRCAACSSAHDPGSKQSVRGVGCGGGGGGGLRFTLEYCAAKASDGPRSMSWQQLLGGGEVTRGMAGDSFSFLGSLPQASTPVRTLPPPGMSTSHHCHHRALLGCVYLPSASSLCLQQRCAEPPVPAQSPAHPQSLGAHTHGSDEQWEHCKACITHIWCLSPR